MRIYKMTATFGKLENATLTLEPGLNIITAPNEWGKSTWCAFLLAMLYGLDTRAKTTKTALADKERYAPWSGAPMEGRIDLNWMGRDITIERRTKRRIPLGEFIAYETHSGLPIEELTAANCGQVLLGVEQTVFRRAGFIRQADLPVTQDEALRRRLNALVTTGDESGAADRLAGDLKDLKNRCRFNKSGLIPQAEKERDALTDKLEEMDGLEGQCGKIQQRLEEVRQWIGQLENHKQALAFADSQANTGRMEQAKAARDQAEQEFKALEAVCETLPSAEDAHQKFRELRIFREEWADVQMERQMLPEIPELPVLPAPFVGMALDAARKMVRKDQAAYVSASKSKGPALLTGLGIAGFVGAFLLVYLEVYLPAAVAGAAAIAALVWSILERKRLKKQTVTIARKYGSFQFHHWGDAIEEYDQKYTQYRAAQELYQSHGSDVEARYQMLLDRREALCGDQEPDVMMDFWQQVQQQWEAYHTARREAQRAQSHFEAIQAVTKPVEAPRLADTLDYSEPDTLRLLSDGLQEQQRLLSRMGQLRGRMEALGDRAQLENQLLQKRKRISQLENTYGALSIALETLADARAELQRRFAPRIAKRAQKLLSDMTNGRYQSLTMGEDFSLQASAAGETTMRDLLWRSDGTMDQLYLALRLAVAEELTPEAPLVLDDALVRFDDVRMTEAVNLLKEMGEKKQIICFTCQSREGAV